MTDNKNALVTNIQGYSIHDGPGIRTVVFLKGCGLACRWCANPECISPKSEIGLVKNLCVKCGRCVDVCPEGALVYEDGKLPVIDRDLCTGCGICSAACTYGALVLYGKPMSAGQIFDAVSRDKMFYDASGGGVTVSGGEALLHPELVRELFEKCRQAGIHTCIETSGQAPESALKQVLPVTDYILFDLKLMDPELHLRYTGQSNNLILSNAKIAAASGVEMLFRIPLIPDVNDSLKNIKATADFLRGLGKKHLRIELMPYHRLGIGKYDSLSRPYHLPDAVAPGQELVDTVRKAFEANGIICLVSR